jgi:hypothetical protein
MPIRNGRAYTFRPKGLSDAQDATNAFPGAMAALTNLVPSPTTSEVWVPRPAGQQIGNFAAFDAPSTVSACVCIGTRVYGMIASQRFPGHDEPFVFDLVAQAYITVEGVTEANTPVTQATTGDWTPPVIRAITTSRIIVTHPGFPGGAGPYFGWFDVSSYTTTTFTANTTAGSDILSSVLSSGDDANPIALGVQPGQIVSGAGIPANDTVQAAQYGTFSLNTTGTTTNGSYEITALGSTTGVIVGMQVTGPGIPTGSTVTVINSSTAVTISQPMTITAAGVAVNFSGGATITLAAPATATATGVALTISGGTPAAPLWGAGNTNTIPLVAVPTCVAGFAGRAYFGVGNAAVPSDSLNPTQQSNEYTLILGDNTAINALEGLPLINTVTGGAVQALIAFKGAETLFQITGDPALGTLQSNQITGAVGSLAPGTITATPAGIAYIATDGLRLLNLTGQVTPPLGTNGQGVSVPFLNAINPTRMCAAFNQDVYRVSVQNGIASGQPFQEYWYDFDLKVWSGPHSLAYSVMDSYPAGGAGAGFVGAPQGVAAALYQSGVIPTTTSVYVENGEPMTWTWRTALCPDNQEMHNNQVIESGMMLQLANTDTVRIRGINESGRTLDTAYLTGVTVQTAKWGQFMWGRNNWGSPAGTAVWGAVDWGAFDWGASIGPFAQYRIPWTGPLDFKQMQVELTGTSAPGQSIGNLYIRYQPTGFYSMGPGR